LGTIPDYSGAVSDGVLLAGVRAGGAAEKAGLTRGDVLIRLGNHDIRSVEDLMYALNALKPGETVTAVVRRQSEVLKLEATLQESARR
jgi:S1-C subfamily serine protease